MKQNTQNRTYTTIRNINITLKIHKHNNKDTSSTKLNISIQNLQPYIK